MIDTLLRTCAGFAAIGAEVQSDVPFDIFAAFGPIMQVLIGDGAAAIGTATWTSVDDNGPYNIPDATPIGLLSTEQVDPVGFQTVGTSVIPNGSTTIDVPIVAVNPGADGSNLSTVVRLDSLKYIESIVVDAPTTGGTDPELTADFVDRLTKFLELSTLTPILGADFARAATLLIPGVFRCAAVDNYNPDDDTSGNEKYVCLSALDSNGTAVSGGTNAAIVALMQAVREWNFVCKTMSAVVNPVDVSYTAYVSSATLEAPTKVLIDAAITNFLNPATWGINQTTGESPIWTVQPLIAISRLIQAMQAASQDIVRLELVKIGTSGGALAAADYNMTGKFPMPQLGTITGTMST